MKKSIQKIIMIPMLSVMIAACSKSEKTEMTARIQPYVEHTESINQIEASDPESSTSREIKTEESATEHDRTTTKTADQKSELTQSERQKEIDVILSRAKTNAEQDRNYILEAIDNKAAQDRSDTATIFIKEQFPEYFSSEELLKKSIEYGCYMENIYEKFAGIDNGGGKYYQMGKIVSEAAKDVYNGSYEATDSYITDKIKELEGILQFFYGQYYGSE